MKTIFVHILLKHHAICTNSYNDNQTKIVQFSDIF